MQFQAGHSHVPRVETTSVRALMVTVLQHSSIVFAKERSHFNTNEYLEREPKCKIILQEFPTSDPYVEGCASA
jgi:hypothetical protein